MTGPMIPCERKTWTVCPELAWIATLAALVIIGVGSATGVHAQAQPSVPKVARPQFNVASIKPCEEVSSGRTNAGGSNRWSPGRLTLKCQTVTTLIRRAFVDFANGRNHIWPPLLTVEGGPAWINSGTYRIEATADGSPGRNMINGPMLQELLEDRFQLRIRRETRTVPVYALTLARGGPKLRPFREGSCVALNLEAPPEKPDPTRPDPMFCGMSDVTPDGYKLYRTTLADFATEFSDRLDRPVIDKTGLAGLFNIQLDLSATDLYAPAAGTGETFDPDSMFAAVRAALHKVGLNLDPARGPGEFLVIDHVERPSPN